METAIAPNLVGNNFSFTVHCSQIRPINNSQVCNTCENYSNDRCLCKMNNICSLSISTLQIGPESIQTDVISAMNISLQNYFLYLILK